jgi:lipoate-protein ligase B
MNTLTACALGPVAYRDGLRIQQSLVRERAEGRTGDWLLFPDHPPVLTMGRGGSESSLIASAETLAAMGIERFDVARGGDVTWHGPGQLVGYTIFDLTRRGRDLHRFLRELEEVIIRTLGDHGIAAERSAGRTGVWTGGAKIASIGVAVRRWVSYHGVALNVCPDLNFFKLIHPCGLAGIQMTSVAEQAGPGAPNLAQVRLSLATRMAETIGYDALEWAESAAAWKTAGEAPGAMPEKQPARPQAA